MKKTVLFVLAIAFVAMSFNRTTPVEDIYKVDVTNSILKWKGYKPTGSHVGTIALISGKLEMKGDKVKGGSFTADLATIKEDKGSKRLEGHLKSKDFFEVETFQTATFEITGTNTNDGQLFVNGNMTIKGITKAISFPAKISKNENTITLTSDTFQINRADFNVTFKSKTFFNNLKDKFINDDFDFQVTIVASK